ncbi:MAG: hypothetical protein JW841_07245 [Deltaproteobacteria bacterium]|nr:hypothetical protein [Deltaproteobacteria bacterium]
MFSIIYPDYFALVNHKTEFLCVSGAISEEEYLAGLQKAGLVDVEVRDRLFYDAPQIEGLAASNLENLCGCEDIKAQLPALLLSLEGKIWSAKVYAHKP